MIPPNAAPPKTITITYPGAEEKVRKQYVYQTYLSPHEHDRMALVPGNRLVVKFKDEVVGEGQAILVEKTTLEDGDRKSTRLNSSHITISYAVFCLKKKKKNKQNN